MLIKLIDSNLNLAFHKGKNQENDSDEKKIHRKFFPLTIAITFCTPPFLSPSAYVTFHIHVQLDKFHLAFQRLFISCDNSLTIDRAIAQHFMKNGNMDMCTSATLTHWCNFFH